VHVRQRRDDVIHDVIIPSALRSRDSFTGSGSPALPALRAVRRRARSPMQRATARWPRLRTTSATRVRGQTRQRNGEARSQRVIRHLLTGLLTGAQQKHKDACILHHLATAGPDADPATFSERPRTRVRLAEHEPSDARGIVALPVFAVLEHPVPQRDAARMREARASSRIFACAPSAGVLFL